MSFSHYLNILEIPGRELPWTKMANNAGDVFPRMQRPRLSMQLLLHYSRFAPIYFTYSAVYSSCHWIACVFPELKITQCLKEILSQSMLPPKTPLMSVVWAAAGDPVDLSCHGCCGQRSFFSGYRWLQTCNWEWEPLKASVPPHPTLPHKKKQSRQKAIKESPWHLLIEMLKCSSLQLMASVGVGWGRTQFSLRGWPLRVCPCSNDIWSTQIGLCGLWGGTEVIGWSWEEWEASVAGVQCMELPNTVY